MSDLTPLLQGLDRLKARMLDGAKAGLADKAGDITDQMRSDSAHGDVTGATHASYVAYVVGRGEDGSASLAQSIQAVEEKNPGHAATASVSIDGELGVILTAPTDYQEDLETQKAGEKAVLGPTIQAAAGGLTAAAAAGSRKALGS